MIVMMMTRPNILMALCTELSDDDSDDETTSRLSSKSHSQQSRHMEHTTDSDHDPHLAGDSGVGAHSRKSMMERLHGVSVVLS